VVDDIAPLVCDHDLAPPERLDAVLTLILRHAGLRERHRQALLRRGLDAESIRANGYATNPENGRSAILATVRMIHDTTGVPGVYYSRRGRGGGYWTFAGAPGLLVPVRDVDGRVRGVQVRPDQVGDDGATYRWVSSSGREGGTGSGTPLHWTLTGDRHGPLVVTEGPLKADVVAHLSGLRVLGFAGCHAGQGRRLVAELDAVGWPLSRPVYLAIDVDFRRNENVRRGLVSILRALDRAGYTVRVATWDPDLGKGLDDALAAGARIGHEVSLEPIETFTGDRPRVRERRDTFADPDPRAPQLPLADAVDAVRGLVSSLVQRPHKGCHVLQATFGVGKTRTTCEVLAHAYRYGPIATFRRHGETRRLRCCVLTDTRTQAETVHQHLLDAGLDAEDVALLVGRDPENCQRYTEVQSLGRHRHSPSAEVCFCCPYGEDGSCAYVAQRDRAAQRELVVACKPAILSESGDLRRYDLVVCDEDLLSVMYETYELNRDQLDRWRTGMDAQGLGEDSPYRTLVRMLELGLAAFMHTGSEHSPTRWPQRHRLIPVLTAAATKLGVDLVALVEELVRRVAADANTTGRLPFESPWEVHGGVHRLRDRMPIRACGDLVAALHEELRGPRPDTRLWVEVPLDGVRPGDRVPPDRVRVLVYRPLDRVLDVLRERCVLVLDATPDLERLRTIFGAHRVHVTNIDVEERVHVTQLIDALRRHPDPNVRAAIRWKLAAEAGEQPVVLTRKALAESDASAYVGVRAVGWFGRHHRATNEFSGAAALLIEDRYSPPVDEARAFVEMWRFDRPPNEPPPWYRPYEGTNFEGAVAGQGDESDPDVAAYLAHTWSADVRQAIGRLRSCRQDRTVRVVIASRDPVPGLRIDRLVTRYEYIHGHRVPVSERRLAALLSRNLARQQEAEERVARVLREYVASNGHLPSVRKLRALAGCRQDLAAKVLRRPDVLRGVYPADCMRTTICHPSGTPPHKTPDTPKTAEECGFAADGPCTPSAGYTPTGPPLPTVTPPRKPPSPPALAPPCGDDWPAVVAVGRGGGVL